MLTLSNNYAYITLCIFSVCRIWLIEESNKIFLSLNTLCWSGFYVFMVCGIVWSGHFTKREALTQKYFFLIICDYFLYFSLQAMSTTGILHKISNCDRYGFFNKKIMMFSQQLVHRYPEFSCGLFHFDLSLGFKVIVCLRFN